MTLENTRQYYADLSVHYFMEGKVDLMTFFRGLSNDPKYTYSNTDTNDWFAQQGLPRPTMDASL